MSVFRICRRVFIALILTLCGGAAIAQSPAAFDCTPETEFRIGGVTFHIIRVHDNACIGSIGWAAIPDPVANLRLTDGWCDAANCAAYESSSTGKAPGNGGFPMRFGGNNLAGPKVKLTVGNNGIDGPVILSGPGGKTMVRILNASREAEAGGDDLSTQTGQPDRSDATTYAITDLPQPLGIYALLQGRTSTEGIGNIGDNQCLINPSVFVGGGTIYQKEIAAPVDGNPYRIASWYECSRFEDQPENCVFHEGSPDAPNPVGSTGGFSFSPDGKGNFEMCMADGTTCGLLFACVRPDGEVTFDREFPSGGRMVDAMLAGPGNEPLFFRYIDNTNILIER